MTSKISFFKIAAEDLRRRVWMFALSCLGSFLALPITFLLANRGYLDRIDRFDSDLTDTELLYELYIGFFQSHALATVGIVLTLGAIITAIWGFRYLYSRKMVDLYHSIPVKRDRLFFIIYLNGLLIWLIPLLVAMGVTLLLLFANMASMGILPLFGSIVVMALRLVGVALVCYLTFYHILLVGVMLSGNVLNALFTTAILGAFAATVYGTIDLLSNAFLDTYVCAPISWGQILWASPLVCPFIFMSDFSNTGAGALFAEIAKSNYDSFLLLRIGNLLVMLFNLATAFVLYRKRPSELAEHGVDHKHAQTLIRLITAILAGLFGSMIFQWILDKDAISWQLFGILLCSILAFGVTDIILHMNFKSFFAHRLQMSITVLVSCLIFFIFVFDLTGFDNRLPAKGSIKNASIFINHYDDNTHPYNFRENGTMYSIDEYYEARSFENLDALYPLLQNLTNEEHMTSGNYATSMQLELRTPFGPFRRSYRILQSDLETLRPIVESKEYLQTFYPASYGMFPLPQQLNADSHLSYTQCTITEAKRMQEIMDAYTADFKDNCTMERLNNGIEVARLSLLYPYEREGRRDTRTYSLNLNVYSHFTRTIAKLKEYYPELVLEKKSLTIKELDIQPQLPLDEVFQLKKEVKSQKETVTLPMTSSSIKYEVAVMEKYITDLTITDAKEIAALLPYLHVGEYHQSSFDIFQEYVYFGRIEQENGYSISCYVKKSDLPLKAPDSVIRYAEEYE